jgi:hypothetical protein
MDLTQVERVVCDGTEIAAIMLGTMCVWPDPWTDIWDEGNPLTWEDGWRDRWSPLSPPPTGDEEQTNGP